MPDRPEGPTTRTDDPNIGPVVVTAEHRLRLDIAYIRRRSFWLDLKILARTVGAVVSRRGAN